MDALLVLPYLPVLLILFILFYLICRLDPDKKSRFKTLAAAERFEQWMDFLLEEMNSGAWRGLDECAQIKGEYLIFKIKPLINLDPILIESSVHREKCPIRLGLFDYEINPSDFNRAFIVKGSFITASAFLDQDRQLSLLKLYGGFSVDKAQLSLSKEFIFKNRDKIDAIKSCVASIIHRPLSHSSALEAAIANIVESPLSMLTLALEEFEPEAQRRLIEGWLERHDATPAERFALGCLDHLGQTRVLPELLKDLAVSEPLRTQALDVLEERGALLTADLLELFKHEEDSYLHITALAILCEADHEIPSSHTQAVLDAAARVGFVNAKLLGLLEADWREGGMPLVEQGLAYEDPATQTRALALFRAHGQAVGPLHEALERARSAQARTAIRAVIDAFETRHPIGGVSLVEAGGDLSLTPGGGLSDPSVD